MELTNEQKRAVLEQKLNLYRQQYYSQQVDARVAQDIGGMEQALKATSENMATTQKFIDALQKMLAELGEADDTT